MPGILLRAAPAALAMAAVLAPGMVAPSAQAQTFTALHTFKGTDGAEPEAGVVQGTDGNLYGTTYLGGTSSACFAGCGTVFKITRGGAVTTLHSFAGTDGERPLAGLVLGIDGKFYGTTNQGGTNGSGTVFKITASGSLTTLYNFCSQSGCTDGAYPQASLIQGTDGKLYGTAAGTGGANNNGTVFSITTNGTFTALHSFAGGTDGAQPVGALVQGTDGKFYGTTYSGGANFSGTVFNILPTGTFTTLYAFCSKSNCTDGASPNAGLIQGVDGKFYGTTSLGGTSNNCGSNGCGTVFKITSGGTQTSLHSFNYTDGYDPSAGVLQGSDGNFYGTTYYGNVNVYGTIFEITPQGTLTTLHSFSGSGSGLNPVGLVQATDGTFYGTTYDGGATGNDGTVFSLSVGLGPFVETQPTSGKVGKAVKILGTNLTGATKVTFNGTAAVFTVVSKSLITTTVPAGATTGTVQVVTPGGTLKSNVPFRVRP